MFDWHNSGIFHAHLGKAQKFSIICSTVDVVLLLVPGKKAFFFTFFYSKALYVQLSYFHYMRDFSFFCSDICPNCRRIMLSIIESVQENSENLIL